MEGNVMAGLQSLAIVVLTCPCLARYDGQRQGTRSLREAAGAHASDRTGTAAAAEMAATACPTYGQGRRGRLRPVVAPVESISNSRATRVATPLSQLPKLVCPIRAHAPEVSKYRSQLSAMSCWPMPGFVQSHTPCGKIRFSRTNCAGVKATV